MKVVILAGGFGTRLGELTTLIPKPMVSIGEKPILWHIMKHYSCFGFNEFIIALGYKSDVIKKYFLDYYNNNSDFQIDLSTGKISHLKGNRLDWKITLIDTGINTMTGGRIKRLQDLIEGESFLATYGDGLSDINIKTLVDFHHSHGKLVTVSAVRPSARFGEMIVNNGIVESFKEKPQIRQGWINGGFFVMNYKFLDLIDDDHTVLEREPLEQATKLNQLMAFNHEGFWQCMDTMRDKTLLEELWNTNNAPWKNW